MSDGWQGEPMGEPMGENHWITVSDKTIGQFSGFLANPLGISTNFHSQSLPVQINFHADNSITYEGAALLLFTNQ